MAILCLFLLSILTSCQYRSQPALSAVSAQDISNIKVAVQYRIVTDGRKFRRSLNDVINILKETKADFVFQGWLTQWPLPEDLSSVPPELRAKFAKEGYTYKRLKKAVSEIKKKIPDIIFGGGVQAEYLYPEEVQGSQPDEQRDKAWDMALDPKKWNINYSRAKMQAYWAKRWGFIENDAFTNEEELKEKMQYFFPDITNKDFQKILLNKIYRQIDAGVDAIWIDMLYVQPTILKQLTNNENHPAVRESYEAIWKIVNSIHRYGFNYGKNISVISWVVIHRGDKVIRLVPPEWCNIDAAMTSPLPEEILAIDDTGKRTIGGFRVDVWKRVVRILEQEYSLPTFARLDYGGIGRTPLSVFSQELTKSEAIQFLKKADDFFTDMGIIFIYPLHGGTMGRPGKVANLSYGRYNWYDALAPEFDTYETIKELAQAKKPDGTFERFYRS